MGHIRLDKKVNIEQNWSSAVYSEIQRRDVILLLLYDLNTIGRVYGLSHKYVLFVD